MYPDTPANLRQFVIFMDFVFTRGCAAGIGLTFATFQGNTWSDIA